MTGRYRLEHELGRGGAGSVWLAVDTVLGRAVAVKRLDRPVVVEPGDDTGDDTSEGIDDEGIDDEGIDDEAIDEALDGVRDEARVAARLQHPAIVPLYDVLAVDGEPWLVMEHLPGGGLDAAIAAAGALPVTTVAAAGAALADALGCAHGLGIVHRDVKPANVLLGGPGVVKLSDFGLAREVAGGTAVSETGIGTPAYLAPELVGGGRGSTEADVWALGATLYTALEGRPPFLPDPDGNVLALLHRISAEDPPAPTRRGPLAELLMHMLARDPAARPTAAEAAETLRGIARRAERRALRHARLRRVGAVAAALVLVVGLLATVRGLVLGPLVDGTAAAVPAQVHRMDAGDLRLADPCRLLDPAQLARFGTATARPDMASFASCETQITGPDHRTPIDVDVRFAPRPDLANFPVHELTVAGPLRIVRTDPVDPRECAQRIFLTDGTQVIVGADLRAPALAPPGSVDPPYADLCAVADAATAAIAERITTEGIGWRALPPSGPPDSLVAVDACKLVDTAQVAAVGVRADPFVGAGHWQCEWVANNGEVYIDVGRTDTLRQPQDGIPTILSGRTYFVLAGGYSPDPYGLTSCVVQTPQRSFTAADGSPRLEAAYLFLDLAGQPQDAVCRTALALAQSAGSRLPPPTP